MKFKKTPEQLQTLYEMHVKRGLPVTRKLDDLNRVTLPKEWLPALGLGYRAPVEMYSLRYGLFITPHYETCRMCGGTNELLEISGLLLCKSCRFDIKEADNLNNFDGRG